MLSMEKVLADRLRGLLGVGDEDDEIELIMKSDVSIFGMIINGIYLNIKFGEGLCSPSAMKFGLYGHFKDGSSGFVKCDKSDHVQSAYPDDQSEFHHFLVFHIHWTDATP